MLRLLLAALCLAWFGVAAVPVHAFPDKNIVYLIPFGPGGQSDLEARRQKPLLEKLLGVDVDLLFKPGVGGSIAWSELSRQQPDGYLISAITLPHIVLQPLAREAACYATEDIEPIALFQSTPVGLAVPKNSPFDTLEDMIAFAKKNPGGLVLAGSGTWSGDHMANLLLQDMAGIELTYVPHSGSAPALEALFGGQAQALWTNSHNLMHHRNKLRVLAMATREPFFALPDVPTFASEGYPLYLSIDRGVGAPPGTPPEIMGVLQEAFLNVARMPEVQEQMRKDGVVSLSLDAPQAGAYIRQAKEYWRPIMKKIKQ